MATPKKNRFNTILKSSSIHHNVFWPSAGLALLFIAITFINKKRMAVFFDALKNGISESAGWFFILVVNIVLIFCFYIAFNKTGRIRLGGQDAKPEFSTASWFAMLFSAGMGIGLLFWSVAEPISHYTSRPTGAISDPQAARAAMNLAFLHWGLHAWGIYALVGLGLAYYTFNRKLPLTISSLFYPVLGKRIQGIWGDIIDVVATLATLFGLATSLGLGAKQINSGLHYLYETKSSEMVQTIIIICITMMATASVVLGLKKGVRRLSQLNVWLALTFLMAMLIFGPTLFITDLFVENLGYYLQKLPQTAFWTEAYEQSDWQNDWTIFYWAWWIAWSPFVGMFIARISRGRSVREFILGVLIVPSLITFIWLSAFGGSALYIELQEPGKISAAVSADVSTSLFVLLEEFPFAELGKILGVLLIISFFVTSSDSGSLVIDSITSGGLLDAPVVQRIFWALAEGAVAIALLWGGGLSALQTASITTGLPFAFMLLIICAGLYKALNQSWIEEFSEPQSNTNQTNKQTLDKQTTN